LVWRVSRTISVAGLHLHSGEGAWNYCLGSVDADGEQAVVSRSEHGHLSGGWRNWEESQAIKFLRGGDVFASVEEFRPYVSRGGVGGCWAGRSGQFCAISEPVRLSEEGMREGYMSRRETNKIIGRTSQASVHKETWTQTGILRAKVSYAISMLSEAPLGGGEARLNCWGGAGVCRK